jgi:hypothetical protein
MSSSFITSNISSSFDRCPLHPYLQIFPHRLIEETWLSLEENMFGFK